MRFTIFLAIALCSAIHFHSSSFADQLNNSVIGEIAKILADDGRSRDGFGKSVDVYQGRVVVGAWESDNFALGDAGRDAGSAYVFDSAGQQEHKLSASDGNDGENFGIAVANETQYV